MQTCFTKWLTVVYIVDATLIYVSTAELALCFYLSYACLLLFCF